MLVRTQDDHAREKLLAAGATEIVPEALEGSLMLASHTLALVGVPMHRVVRLVRDQREARYTLLKGYFHGQDDSTLEDFDQERLVSFLIPERAKAQGRTLGSYKLEGLGIQVLSLRRRLGQQVLIDDNTHLEAGDTLVLCGTTEALALAQMKLAKQH